MGIFAFLFSPIVFGILYPLSASAGFATYVIVKKIVHAVAPTLDIASQRPFALIAAAIVFWTASRRDHRTADKSRQYWLARHVLRVFLLSAYITVNIFHEANGGFVLPSLRSIPSIFIHPTQIAVMGVVAVGANWFLTKTPRLREWWHIIVQFVNLRPGTWGS
jgi:hypothetical protein